MELRYSAERRFFAHTFLFIILHSQFLRVRIIVEGSDDETRAAAAHADVTERQKESEVKEDEKERTRTTLNSDNLS